MRSDRLSYLLRADGTGFIGRVVSVSAAGSAAQGFHGRAAGAVHEHGRGDRPVKQQKGD